MRDLADFLRARLDEDEQAAQLMNQHYPAPWEVADRGWMAHVTADAPGFRVVTQLEQGNGAPEGTDDLWLGEVIGHVARHDPARVLAEIEAKRGILAMYDSLTETIHPPTSGISLQAARTQQLAIMKTLKLLAAPYSDHPEYQETWRP